MEATGSQLRARQSGANLPGCTKIRMTSGRLFEHLRWPAEVLGQSRTVQRRRAHARGFASERRSPGPPNQVWVGSQSPIRVVEDQRPLRLAAMPREEFTAWSPPERHPHGKCSLLSPRHIHGESRDCSMSQARVLSLGTQNY